MKKYKKKRFVRVNDVISDYGIGRTTINKLIAEKRVISHLVRDRGATRGLRLIDVKSLEKYIKSHSDGTDGINQN